MRAVSMRDGLVELRALPREEVDRTARYAVKTHELGDLGGLFTSTASADGGGKRIRICLVDTLLQTGGAEWYATQVSLMANASVFEVVVVAYNTEGSALATRLRDAGIRVIDSTTWSRSGLEYKEWKEKVVFDLLERLSPDLLFFSSQYLYEQLSKDRLAPYPVVVRISNFHAEDLHETDFSAADRIICCTDEQFAVVSSTSHRDKATLISTGVDTDRFAAVSPAEKHALKNAHGVGGKTVVLFVARLGDRLKRTPVFQEVVRAIQQERSDVAFVVVGYFESHNNEAKDEFSQFVEDERIVWFEGLAPWEMPDIYRMADVLLSTSDVHEGLSNTVLQALSSGVVPVVTPSAGMHELVEPGRTGFMASDFEVPSIVSALVGAVDAKPDRRAELASNGRRLIEDQFSLIESAAEYQRTFVELHRTQPTRVCITDGYFGVGGAEWLAALLILNSDPAETRFDLVMHRRETEFVEWLMEHGVPGHEATAGMNWSDWLRQGLADSFSRLRPDIVMPCTITTWPHHEPFYRLLIISQNASDAAVLTPPQYDQADYFLCVSRDVKDHLSPAHHWKMSVLRNSIDLEMFRENAGTRRRVREELGMPHDRKVVLWCARMHEARKRVDVLKEVIHDMRDDDVHFLVVGYFRGDEGDKRGWQAFLADHPKVTWVQGATPWETPEYYAASDVFLSTSGFKQSDFEGLSVATVQALATSLPVVTTRSGGQHEVVEEGVNGRLVDTGDAQGLASALRAVTSADEEAFGRMRRRSRDKALAEFDIREHARLYTRIARLLKGNVGPALIADPELAGDVELRHVGDLGEGSRRTAAAFVEFTWPLVREADREVAPDVVLEAGPDRDGTVSALRQAQTSVAPGGTVVVRGVGRDYVTAQAPPPSAATICAVLDYLEGSFAHWASVRRDGSALMLKKLAGGTP